MKKLLVIFIVVLLGCIQITQASDLQRSKRIIGGELASPTPWAVKLIISYDTYSGSCTGSALAESWILTAQHCLDNKGNKFKSITAHYATGMNNLISKEGLMIDRTVTAPAGDIALLHLKNPYSIDKYPDLSFEDNTHPNMLGDILGYGKRNTDITESMLYQVQVQVIDKAHVGSLYNGDYLLVEGVNGTSRAGDSGGPFLIKNKIVGVLHGTGLYSNLSQSAQWVKYILSNDY